jgi:hypothetical protein
VSYKGSYLPKRATIDEATKWLEEATGESWPLGRLLDSGHLLSLGVWLRPDERTPPEVLRDVFQNRVEGFWAPLCFASDVSALMADRTLVLTMTRVMTGELVTFTPGLCFPLADLRIEGTSLQAMFEGMKPENQHLTSWLRLPEGERHVVFSELASLMAESVAIPGESPIITASREIQFESEVAQFADDRKIPIVSPLTGRAMSDATGRARKSSIIKIADLKRFLGEHYSMGLWVGQSTEHKGAEISVQVPAKDVQAFTIKARPVCVPQALLDLPCDQVVRFTHRLSSTLEDIGTARVDELIDRIQTIIDRQALNKFTIAEAALILGEHHTLDAKKLLQRMIDDVQSGKSGHILRVFGHDTKMTRTMDESLSRAFDYVLVADLNAWLAVKSRLVINPLVEQFRFFGVPVFQRLNG